MRAGYLPELDEQQQQQEQREEPPPAAVHAALQRLVLDYLGNAACAAGGRSSALPRVANDYEEQEDGGQPGGAGMAICALEHWLVLSFVEELLAAQKVRV